MKHDCMFCSRFDFYGGKKKISFVLLAENSLKALKQDPRFLLSCSSTFVFPEFKENWVRSWSQAAAAAQIGSEWVLVVVIYIPSS